MTPPDFNDAFRAALHQLFVWRRDVRRFRPDALGEGMLERLLQTACLAPSVGLSQPWRFVIVDDPARRAAVMENFQACNHDALEDFFGDEAVNYSRLKLAGLREAPSHVAVFCDDTTTRGHGLGRRTMPEMLSYSAVTAVCYLWLAARAEGLGVGWVSILDPEGVREVLDLPAGWRFIGYLCIGYPERLDDTPELEREGWEQRASLEDVLTRR